MKNAECKRIKKQDEENVFSQTDVENDISFLKSQHSKSREIYTERKNEFKAKSDLLKKLKTDYREKKGQFLRGWDSRVGRFESKELAQDSRTLMEIESGSEYVGRKRSSNLFGEDLTN